MWIEDLCFYGVQPWGLRFLSSFFAFSCLHTRKRLEKGEKGEKSDADGAYDPDTKRDFPQGHLGCTLAEHVST